MRIAACALALIALPAVGDPPPELTAEQDHRLMLEQLGIDHLRPGVNGWDPDAPNAANSDESKATPYDMLPDPLVLENGGRVTTPEQWWGERRPEIVELLSREIYGRVPDDVPSVDWQIVSSTERIIDDISLIQHELLGTVDNSEYPGIDVSIPATLVLPVSADEQQPAPVMIDFYFRWGPLPEPGSMPPLQDWHREFLERGWGYALLTPTAYQQDSGAGLTRGIIGLANHGKPREPDDWGTLRAWGWGAGRLLDHFEKMPSVDHERVGITGLSRYGKAAIVTMAFDRRFAIGFIGSSGQGGVKIMRRDFGERVENVASSGEYHWMAGNYLKYAGPLTPNDMPVDAHHLVALCAPRPVFVSVGSLNVEGTWVDAVGNFLGAAHASPVYELLGAAGLDTLTMPPEGTSLTDGDLAFRQHAGGHTREPNWPHFIDFADRYLGDHQ